MSSNSGGGVGGNLVATDSNPTRGSQRRENRNESTSQRYSNLIYDSEVFLTKLREFKPQSLGSLEARRKSSSTLIFPNPPQACMGPPKCTRYPHSIKPTPGYWIECHGPGINANRSAPQQNIDLISGGANASNKTPSAELHSSMGLSSGDYRAERGSCVFSSSVSQERFTSSRISKDLQTDVIANESHASRQESTNTPAIPRRQQSFDSSSSDAYHERHQHTSVTAIRVQKCDPIGDTDGCQYISTGDADKSLSSSWADSKHTRPDSELTQPTSSNSASASATTEAKASETMSRSTRRKLTKRMMTRDDIDLHKPRRGTPNITITEPSFNQSTIWSPTNRHQFRSSSSNRKTNNQIDNNTSHTVDSSNQASQTQSSVSSEQRVPYESKTDVMLTYNNEPQSSLDEVVYDTNTRDSFDDSKPGDMNSSEDGSRQSLMSIEFDESEPNTRPQTSSPNPYRNIHYQQFYQQHSAQHHRPSVIPEDSGTENVLSGPNYEDRGEYYCGLSTSIFHKKSYLDSSRSHQFECLERFKDGPLELISFEEENYEKYYYGCEHWNYFTNDELLGPVMLSLKQEVNNQRDHFHVLLRTVSYTLHGTIPASTICADRYDREAIVRELSEIAKLKPPLMLGQLPSTPDDLLKLDRIFIKTELKVGVIYIKDGQAESEEAILGNREESPLFAEFLDLLGDRITLKGFDRYKGGLDTVHNLTGTESVYTMWRNIEIMFHVSTMLPHEENDPQKLQKKRHIGNDIVCVAFIESDDMLFWPGCIKSYFLHTFITVRTSSKPPKEGEKRKYFVSCVCRNEVQYAFKPYLVERDEFYKSDCFREWLLVKIVNGERASYSAPKFARMQDRTRSQLLEDIITNLANHLMTGQIPKPYRRGSWRPLGHTRASSPLEDSMKDYFEDYDQLAKDFATAFCGPSRSMLCDVVFKVKDKDDTYKLVHGVRAVMAIRSRSFLEMLYGFLPPGTAHSSLQNQTNLSAIEIKALSGESSSEIAQTSKNLMVKRGSVGADTSRKSEERERRQSMLPNLAKSVAQKPNYLTVPSTSSGAGVAGGSGTGGMIKNAFNRLVSGNWSGWSGNVKGYKGEQMLIKVDQNKARVDLNSLAICKEIAKIDAEKLAQREFEIKEFDYDTFQQTIEYIHNGQCNLSYETIPGLICAAEHYDLPDLLHACFHHANTHLRLNAAPRMLNSLYQNSCFYVTAMQLLDSIYEYIDPQGNEFFTRPEYLELNESVLTTLLTRKSLQVTELNKFLAIHNWVKNQISMKHQQQQQQQQSTNIDQETVDTFKRWASLDKPETMGEFRNENEASEYRNLMGRLVKTVNVKLDKISNEELVKFVLPTKVFSNEKIFEVMADESRIEY